MRWLAFVRQLVLSLACLAGVQVGVAAPDASPAPEASRVPKPSIQRAIKGEQCVADPAYMRRNHMALLNHQRDETVHRGVRDAKSSLKGCIDCHAGAESGSVAQTKTDFCVSCHTYAAVKLDCFGCHSSKPQAAAPVPWRQGATLGVRQP